MKEHVLYVKMKPAKDVIELNRNFEKGEHFMIWDMILRFHEKSILVDSSLLFFFSLFYRAVRFKGYQQQDSQELLRYLLDGMRAEEHQVSTF